MHPLLAAAGHQLVTPTYTGVGERVHLANPEVDLETHIADMLGVLQFRDLENIILIGHSYGGMVATGVADRARGRIAQLVYLDAFVPRDGESLSDLLPPERAQEMRARAKAGDGWRIPPNPMPPDTPEADAAFAAPRRVPQPLKTFEQRLRLTNGEPVPPRHYIYCKRNAPGDGFRRFYERAQSEPGWRAYALDASHNPHVTAPDALTALLSEIAAGVTK
jgi:pimeloyl-ACP methyl ester carboxylesterase